jgi:hypothetical protein
MKWTMVLVGVLVLSMCSSAKSTDPTVGDEPTTATIADESTTTTEPPTTTASTSTTQPEVVPDLSGVWSGEKWVDGQIETGTVLISQVGMTFTLSFSEGFRCQPDHACEFDGTVETLTNDDGTVAGYVWMAANSGVADKEGGTYESFFGLQPASDAPDTDLTGPANVDLVSGEEKEPVDMYMGDGESIYHHPPDPDMNWSTYLWIYR